MREKNERFKDITGEKFNKLTAIKRIGTNKHRTSIWLFLCDCGTEKEINASSVLNGATKSCGCLTNIKDITGKKFNRLTPINLIAVNERNRTIWLFSCECGTQKELDSSHVVRGTTKSCGCLMKEESAKANFRHGGCGTRLYKTWDGMRSRCENIKIQNYKNYGGRGISVCQEWHDFSVFRDWALINGYSDDLTIDRIDTNKNYEPSNVRFATKTEQARNKRNTIWYEINGIKKTLVEWCEILNIPFGTARSRIQTGRSPFLNKYNETRAYIYLKYSG